MFELDTATYGMYAEKSETHERIVLYLAVKETLCDQVIPMNVPNSGKSDGIF